jgi:hypothetical protein
MDNYNDILNKHSSDKGTNPYGRETAANGYGEIYDKYFRDYREIAMNICDIGIDEGFSLLANKEYFINANIHGVDIDDKSFYDSERIKTHIVDQNNENDINIFVNKMKNDNIQFDIIIDDASHDVVHQQVTFGKLFEILKHGGLYIIEDLGSSFFKEGVNLYGYIQTKEKIENNTVKFLTNKPLRSPWISSEILDNIDIEIDHILTFDKLNKNIPYLSLFPCIEDYPLRSITSIIKKK